MPAPAGLLIAHPSTRPGRKAEIQVAGRKPAYEIIDAEAWIESGFGGTRAAKIRKQS